MRASGHKSEASIRLYSCRLSDPKKQEMSDCLSGLLGCRQREHKDDSTLRDLTVDKLDTIFYDSVFSDVTTNQEKSQVPELQQPVNCLNLNSLPSSVNTMGINMCPCLNY